MAEPDFRPVLAAYSGDFQPQRAEFLASAGGFSGARLWKLQTPRGTFCLRRWSQEHPTRERLEFIQAVLWHVDQEGFHLAPVPVETMRHAGYVQHAGHFWELTPWTPGAADYRQSPSTAKLRVALEALARFHLAAASFPLPEHGPVASPGMLERRERIKALEQSGLSEIARAIQPGDWPDLAAIGLRIVELYQQCVRRVAPLVEQAAALRVGLQPCIRDIWHAHVLFEGSAVSGIIDFGALRAESVAADIARLLGSLARDHRGDWEAGLAAYRQIRPLSAAEMSLILAFDESSVLLGGLQWLDWIYREGRQFENRAAVLERLSEIAARLVHLAKSA